jgi:hypothetical protein
MRRCEIGLELAGGAAAAWPPGDAAAATDAAAAARREAEASLFWQGGSLGGGSNEIQRNIISERVLGMPREHAADRDVPYREVRRG